MEDSNEYKQPIDLQSEMFLLARMLNSVNAANDAIAALVSDDFSLSDHQVVFSAMRSLQALNCEIEPLTVASQMEKLDPGKNHINFIFGLKAYQFGDHEEVKLFIDNILEASRLRKLMLIGNSIISESSKAIKPSEQIHTDSLTKFESVFSNTFESQIFTMKELVKKEFAESGKDILGYLEQQMENHRQGIQTYRGVPCGFTKLDDALSGFCPGHFIVLGARPGIGKTTFALNLIMRLAKKGVRVGFFSLEMTAEEALTKMGCIASGLDSGRVTRGLMNHEEFQRIVVAMNAVADLPIVIDEQESLKISQVISRAKRMVAVNQTEILFVDYLGEVKGDGKFSSKQEEVQAVSKGLRGLAKKLRIPIVCIVQLNRDMEKEERTPRKSDLRESGQIEADAHSILLLNRPSAEDENKQPGLTKLHIVKNRFGRETTIHFNFEGDKGLFTEIDYSFKPEG